MTSKKICIIGGSGFVGRHLVQAIVKQGHTRINLLTRSGIHNTEPSTRVEIINGDLLKLESLSSFISTGDIVVNLAYLNNETIENNLLAAKNLAFICKLAGASRLVHLSTAVVVGVSKVNTITSETQCYPRDSYETSKLAIENLLIEELTGYCELSILRPTAIFGENGLNLVKMIDELKNGNYWMNTARITLHGKRKMNLVSVENVVAAILFLTDLKESSSNERYIISDDDDELNNYADIVSLVTENLKLPKISRIKLPFHVVLMSVLLRIKKHSNTNLNRVYSAEKLMQLGYRKKITFKQALLDYLDSCR